MNFASFLRLETAGATFQALDLNSASQAVAGRLWPAISIPRRPRLADMHNDVPDVVFDGVFIEFHIR